MKQVLLEEISAIKSLMKINEDMITVSSGGYDFVTTDNDATKTDKINKALLDDINTAAKRAGVKVTVTTAKTGHSDKTTTGNQSRHTTQQAVDLAILDGVGAGGATNAHNGNPKFRVLGDKVVAELEKMGYTRNTEGPSNPKAVLWQTNTGGNHFNHIHVSNKTGEASKEDDQLNISPERKKELEKVAASIDSQEDPFDKLAKAVSSIRQTITDLPSKVKSFGESIDDSPSLKIIPKSTPIIANHNGKIVSPNVINSSCENSLILRTSINKNIYFIEYCNISDRRKSAGDLISVGDRLGKSDEDVYVTFYNYEGKIENKDIVSSPKTSPSNDEKPADDIRDGWSKHFRDEQGQYGETFADAFYNLFKNLNPLSSRYAIDPETNKPIKIHQGGFATTKDSKSKPSMAYKDRIGYSSSRKGAKLKGKSTPKNTSESLKEELQHMKRLMK